MHDETTKIDLFRELLNAESEIKFTVGGNEIPNIDYPLRKKGFTYIVLFEEHSCQI